MKKESRPHFIKAMARLDKPGVEALLPERPMEPWERMVFVPGQKKGEVLVGGPADMSDIDYLIDQEKERRGGTFSVVVVCRVEEKYCYTRIDYEGGRSSAPYSAFFEPDQSCICDVD